jgi:hypothetical protein
VHFLVRTTVFQLLHRIVVLFISRGNTTARLLLRKGNMIALRLLLMLFLTGAIVVESTTKVTVIPLLLSSLLAA